MKKIGLIFFLSAWILNGCNQQAEETPKPAGPLPMAQQQATDLQRMDAAKKLARQDGRVEDATAVIIKKDLSVGLKVENFNRLFLRDIRKTVFHRLRQTYPQYQVHVTTDHKLFDSLQKMEAELREHPLLSPTSAQEKLRKINEDMKG
ncbi:YhcN/YlaJ family sporulation lipoprotein [Kroppenstedtia eburnea]|uniref:Sporulation lipoprotein YhcN/YlaJ (Spore_YhcN_YlaJ) n=2 Tax=Kroppenstedtia TaxID=1274351 RepID=A0A1N7KFW9_9BACL|nr:MULTISPECIES: YhcN/YlaJ family sporulation lipoprotein [Kroppenstedtia]EGK12022.1 sporulation lipoprotein YhcN/YlaJ [Desmospora sp. 8437]QKI83001.1 hypothetical protein GXN75_13910 [Kroppenstedtia eburnea]GGA50158.1 hypothetical protein GCM10007416_24140 [Kroppenstedtia guangzhouensis]SIS60506.1 Sporulation lipoprotein YhcN/YlaJ (Spore_YhcN_YlaJ) [Kroppenstedtia eburnea]